jgi:DNA-directed RNA polymerase subunit beta
MVAAIQTNFRVRQSFGKIDRIIEIPNLIDIQMKSYDKFLQTSIEPGTRQDYGLQGVFRSVFPIRDFTGASWSSSATRSRSPSTMWTSADSAA